MKNILLSIIFPKNSAYTRLVFFNTRLLTAPSPALNNAPPVRHPATFSATAPIIRMPVPKKKDEAMGMPKYLLKMVLRKVYRLAHPRLMTILLKTAMTSEPALPSKEAPVSSPAATAPTR